MAAHTVRHNRHPVYAISNSKHVPAVPELQERHALAFLFGGSTEQEKSHVIGDAVAFVGLQSVHLRSGDCLASRGEVKRFSLGG